MKKRREAETRLLEMCQEIDVDKDGALGLDRQAPQMWMFTPVLFFSFAAIF